MPWKPMNTVDLRKEFVQQSVVSGLSFSELCSRYGISRKTGYRWQGRYRTKGLQGLEDLSNKPHDQPVHLNREIEGKIVALRHEYPVWGARKLRKKLLERGGVDPLPAISTVHAVLKRNGLIDPEASLQSTPFTRLERDTPNSLWQMDFKGWFHTLERPCHPLTILDDHSRFNITLAALPGEKTGLVQAKLEEAFTRYGLPDAILTDNGSPWGSDQQHRFTVLGTWLMRLGIEHIHSRPYHPQTQGKEERFHRTLKLELISRRQWQGLEQCQAEFDIWRSRYNTERPHEGIADRYPAELYRHSQRKYGGTPPPPEYPPSAIVRKVDAKGKISFRGHPHLISKAFRGEYVRLIERPVGEIQVLYGPTRIASLKGLENTTKVLPMSSVRL